MRVVDGSGPASRASTSAVPGLLPATSALPFVKWAGGKRRLVAAILAAAPPDLERYPTSILVVSYSSNSVPARDEMIDLLRQAKRRVTVHECDHRYSFGTHGHRVGANQNRVQEYLFVAR